MRPGRARFYRLRKFMGFRMTDKAKTKKRVWLNQWFSTAYHIVNLLREDDDFDFYIIGTSRNMHSPVRLVCDEWYEEPEYKDSEVYLSFCVDFCQAHDIDIFIPRRGMGIVAHNLARFKNTKIMVEHDVRLFDICNDKLSCYEYIKPFLPEIIPEYALVKNAEDFEKSCAEMSARYDAVCYKASRDEGATTYRKFNKHICDALGSIPRARGIYIAALFGEAYAKMSSDSVLLVMPHLNGLEVSVDVLRTGSGLILLPRYKPGGRYEYITYEPDIIALCQTIISHIPLDMPFNIQFKYHDGKPYLLEINTRMSGGVQLAVLASGVNIPNIACNKLLGIEKEWHVNTRGTGLTYIETPLIVRDDYDI